MEKSRPNLQSSYDRVAERYATEYFDELKRKPFDRELLDNFADSLRGQGEVLEIGCGPGQIARYLQDRGLKMRGIDLSEKMIECAKGLNPDIEFEAGDMLALETADQSFAGVVSFYAIIHLKRDDVTRSFEEMRRVLVPGGKLLVSFHGGEGTLHRDEWYGQPVCIDVNLFRAQEISNSLESAGFEMVRIAEREPYEFEYPTKRMYAQAMKPP